jgi:two-component sensor histidine kinase
MPDAPRFATRKTLIVLAAVLAPALAALVWGVVTFRSELRLAEQTARENVGLVAQYVDRLVQTQRVLHNAAVERIMSSEVTKVESEAFHNFLAAVDSAQQNIYGMAVVGFDGRLVASSRTFPVTARFGPRDYINAVAAGEPLFIDRIKLDPSGADAFVIATPFSVTGFDGLIVTSVATEAVTDFLRGVAVKDEEAASLMRTDGKLLVRNFPSEPVLLPPDAPGRVSIQGRATGVHRVVALTDGIERIYAFEKVTDLPLYANFGLPMLEVWRNWMWKVFPVWALLAAIGLVSYMAMDRMRRGFQHKLAEEIGQKRLQQAEDLAEQRQQLMREMNHRVKNNLSLVTSMINMKMRSDPTYDGRDLQSRIHAISEVHDLMYRADDGTEVDAGEMLRTVSTNPALIPDGAAVSMDVDAETGIMVGPGLSTPLALIASEMITNAVKHAFPDGVGQIGVRLYRAEGGLVLDIEDDGVGIGEAPKRRSGITIIDALVRQVNGQLQRCDGRGTRYRLTVPLPGHGATAEA